jgi:hypothetical protein
MSIADIGKWLKSLGLPTQRASSYVIAFKQAGIDAAAMHRMKPEDLVFFGVAPKWQRILVIAKWSLLTRSRSEHPPQPPQENDWTSPTAIDGHPAVANQVMIKPKQSGHQMQSDVNSADQGCASSTSDVDVWLASVSTRLQKMCVAFVSESFSLRQIPRSRNMHRS